MLDGCRTNLWVRVGLRSSGQSQPFVPVAVESAAQPRAAHHSTGFASATVQRLPVHFSRRPTAVLQAATTRPEPDRQAAGEVLRPPTDAAWKKGESTIALRSGPNRPRRPARSRRRPVCATAAWPPARSPRIAMQCDRVVLGALHRCEVAQAPSPSGSSSHSAPAFRLPGARPGGVLLGPADRLRRPRRHARAVQRDARMGCPRGLPHPVQRAAAVGRPVTYQRFVLHPCWTPA